MQNSKPTRNTSINRLIELLDDKFQQKDLEKKLADIQAKIEGEIQQLSALEVKAIDEFDDAEVLKTQVVPQLIYKTFGDQPLDKKIELEEQELINAQVEYFSQQKSIDLLKSEAEVIKQQLRLLTNIDKKLARLGRKKQPNSLDEKGQLAHSIAQIYAVKEDIHSVILLGKEAESLLEEILNNSKEIRKFLLLDGFKIPTHSEKKAERQLFRKGIKSLTAFDRAFLETGLNFEKTNTLRKTGLRQKFIPINKLEAIFRNTPKFKEIQDQALSSFSEIIKTFKHQHQLVIEKIKLLEEKRQSLQLEISELKQQWEPNLIEI